jgi:pimeloyl-ACP methyl ester carboxylesterase
MWIPPLPDRAAEVVRGLPYPFARAQLDRVEPSYAFTRDRLVVSTDAWSGRQLAEPVGTGWRRLTEGPGWHRRPRTDQGDLCCELFDDPAHDRGRPVRVPLPDMSTVDSAPVPAPAPPELPEGALRGLGNVVELGPWLSREELLVVRETWPARHLHRWNVSTGDIRPVLSGGPMVVSGVRRAGGLIGFTWTSTTQPKRLELAEPGELLANTRRLVLPDRPRGPAPAPARAVLVDGPACALPCLRHDPVDPPRGTVLLLHGGPHGTHLETWSPLVDSLVLAGWRVVLPNVRGSGLRDPRLRPPRPARYGVEDVADVLAVARTLATGPIVLGGRSYGGYLAARAAAELPGAKAVFALGGFLASHDLRGVRHDEVAAFLAAPGTRFAPDRALAGVPHFVAHGTADPRIPVEAVAAHQLPEDSEFLVLAGEGHGVRTDAGARTAFPALLRWLDAVT